MRHARLYITLALAGGKQSIEGRSFGGGVVTGFEQICLDGCKCRGALEVSLILTLGVFPPAAVKFTNINCEMATWPWESDHITYFVSDSLPGGGVFCCVKDHAKLFAESDRQQKRHLGFNDIDGNQPRDTLYGDGYLCASKEHGGSSNSNW